MKLQPDDRWDFFFKIKTYDAYLAGIERSFYLKDCVDVDVLKSFRIVRKLIELAYYEYEFWDVASLKAMLAFELALKQKFKEINGGQLKRPRDLMGFITWFKENGYFEKDDGEFLDQIRKIRNHHSHPERYSFGGSIVSWHLPAVANLINDLYECRDLRAERKTQTAALNKKICDLVGRGAILTFKDGPCLLLYQFILVFFNNKVKPACISCGYQTIFDIPETYAFGDPIAVQPTYSLSCALIVQEGDRFIAFDETGDEFFRLELATGEDHVVWASWKERHEAFAKVNPIIAYSDSYAFSKIYAPAVNEFYSS